VRDRRGYRRCAAADLIGCATKITDTCGRAGWGSIGGSVGGRPDRSLCWRRYPRLPGGHRHWRGH